MLFKYSYNSASIYFFYQPMWDFLIRCKHKFTSVHYGYKYAISNKSESSLVIAGSLVPCRDVAKIQNDNGPRQGRA